MADDVTAHAKEQQKKGAEAKAKSVEEAYGHQGKPTPTQEENDLAALGVAVDPHEDDGSGPSPELRLVRQSEAGKPAGSGYTTRSATPTEHPAPAPAKPKT
jgi:hypothetical protein